MLRVRSIKGSLQSDLSCLLWQQITSNSPFKPKETVMHLTTPAELVQIKYAEHREFMEVFFIIINLDL